MMVFSKVTHAIFIGVYFQIKVHRTVVWLHLLVPSGLSNVGVWYFGTFGILGSPLVKSKVHLALALIGASVEEAARLKNNMAKRVKLNNHNFLKQSMNAT